jgi:hypothetical protein
MIPQHLPASYARGIPFTLWQQNSLLHLPANSRFDPTGEVDAWVLDPRGILSPETVLGIWPRNELARLLRHFRNLVRKQYPGAEMAGYRYNYVWAARQISHQAIMDCSTLDSALCSAGGWTKYSNELQLSTAGALMMIHPVAHMKAAKIHEINLAALEEGKSPGLMIGEEMAINSIRATILDGWSVEQALQIHEPTISLMAKEGSHSFFERLPRILGYHSELTDRDTISWILRGWLPLNFGECPANGKEAYRRFEVASQLLGFQLPDNREGHRDAWITAWVNVRNKALKPAHSKSITL